MASQVGEIRRLREEVAKAEAERDEALANYAELAGHTQEYIAVKDEADGRTEYERDLARYQQGWLAAETAIDDLHREGMAHDQHGRLRVMEVPQELPEPKSLDRQIADLDDWERREGEWRFQQSERERRNGRPSRRPATTRPSLTTTARSGTQKRMTGKWPDRRINGRDLAGLQSHNR